MMSVLGYVPKKLILKRLFCKCFTERVISEETSKKVRETEQREKLNKEMVSSGVWLKTDPTGKFDRDHSYVLN